MNENNPKNLNNSEIAYETEQQTNMEEKENTIPFILKILNDATPEKFEHIIEMIEKQKLGKNLNFQLKSLLIKKSKEMFGENNNENNSKKYLNKINKVFLYFEKRELEKGRNYLKNCDICVKAMLVLLSILSIVVFILYLTAYNFDESTFSPFPNCTETWKTDNTTFIYTVASEDCTPPDLITRSVEKEENIKNITVAYVVIIILAFFTHECTILASKRKREKIIHLVNTCINRNDESKRLTEIIKTHPKFGSDNKIQYIAIIYAIFSFVLTLFYQCEVFVKSTQIFMFVASTISLLICVKSFNLLFDKCLNFNKAETSVNNNSKQDLFEVLNEVYDLKKTNSTKKLKIMSIRLYLRSNALFRLLICFFNAAIVIFFVISFYYYTNDVLNQSDSEKYCRCDYYGQYKVGGGNFRHREVYWYKVASMICASISLSLVILRKDLIIAELCNKKLKYFNEITNNDPEKVKMNSIKPQSVFVKYGDLLKVGVIQIGLITALNDESVSNWCTNGATKEIFFFGISAIVAAIISLYNFIKLGENSVSPETNLV